MTDKTYELTVKMNNGYVIYEYRKHFSGFLQADASGAGGNTGDDFTCEIPSINNIKNGPDTTSSDSVCKKYKSADADDTRTVTWKEIAQAWKAVGNNMKYCPAALVIGGGECQTLSNTAGGCNIKATGKSGIWQNDWAQGHPNFNLFNPCDNAKAVYHQIVRPAPGGDPCDKGCYTYNTSSDKTPVVLRQPTGSLYGDTGGNSNNNCNWLGPFCHYQKDVKGGPANCGGTGKPSGTAWTGGANTDQPQGFPYYYQSKFLEYNNKNPPTCDKSNTSNCLNISKQSYQLAKQYCDSVT